MAWTEELKAKVIAAYEAKEPTAETSTEIIKELAETFEQSPNGIRMVLVQAGVYVKKSQDAEKPASKTTGGSKAEGTKRVSKEDSIAALRAAIEAKGADVDEDILGKLTGKAAIYFTSVLAK
jgi:hypothetical protein